ncbi:MAG: glycosyl transferase [Nostocoides sp.]
MPHLLYFAWGFPPAAKSCAYRMLATANSFSRAGWDVTVVTVSEEAWVREFGLDTSLLPLVDEAIEVVRLPLFRTDLETDIHRFGRLRAQYPPLWRRWSRWRDGRDFPEPVFGRWRDQLVAAARGVHRSNPVTLLLTSAAPYTFFAPALDLWQSERVPYVLDYRDAWALDIIGDRPAPDPGGRARRVEQELLQHATEAWFVNRPIQQAYAELFPSARERMMIVPNGADLPEVAPEAHPRTGPPWKDALTFGYLGTATFGTDVVQAACDGWRLARQAHPVLARSRLEFRGHFGAGASRGSSGHTHILDRYADDGVIHGGPVPKGEVADLYASWDVLLLMLAGGRYVTSGKVFDYMATGLPIMSAHRPEHAVTEILDGYPLWVPTRGVTADALAEAFLESADLAARVTPAQTAAARRYSETFERYAQLAPAVDRLTARFPGMAAS